MDWHSDQTNNKLVRTGGAGVTIHIIWIQDKWARIEIVVAVYVYYMYTLHTHTWHRIKHYISSLLLFLLFSSFPIPYLFYSLVPPGHGHTINNRICKQKRKSRNRNWIQNREPNLYLFCVNVFTKPNPFLSIVLLQYLHFHSTYTVLSLNLTIVPWPICGTLGMPYCPLYSQI